MYPALLQSPVEECDGQNCGKEDIGLGRGVTQSEIHKCILINVIDQDVRRVKRTALGQHIDDVESADQDVDHRDQQHEKRRWGYQWNCNVSKLLKFRRSVHSGGIIQIMRHFLETGRIENRVE